MAEEERETAVVVSSRQGGPGEPTVEKLEEQGGWEGQAEWNKAEGAPVGKAASAVLVASAAGMAGGWMATPRSQCPLQRTTPRSQET